MKEKLFNIVLIDCVSYTVLSLLMTIKTCFFQTTINADSQLYLSLLAVTTIIAILIVLSAQIKIDSFLWENILFISTVLLVVLVFGGGIFHWFTWELQDIMEVVLISLMVYGCTWLVVYLNDCLIARKINQKLAEVKNEKY